jgi:GMP synthase (glutamine-hydrolysing)
MPDDFDACIITGDPHNITDGLKNRHRGELELLNRLGPRKLFASCFAHQLVAIAHGGSVERRDRRLLRWETVSLASGHPACEGIDGFQAVCMNIDRVAGVPPGACRLGWSESCENQVLAYGDNVLTCQSHPEMSGSRGYSRTKLMALAIGGARGWKTLAATCPPALPPTSAFAASVARWLADG